MLKKIINRGNANIVAFVYEKKEHKINNSLIDSDALKIINKIKFFGGEAFIVGGAVRDLILGKKPKDFDIVTSMTPNQLKSHFKNVRIIGHRFKLAHFYFQDNKIIEVATFRALESKCNVNIYGNMDEDAYRRDFTINALYYDPDTQKIYDYLGGYADLIENRQLVEIIPLDKIFKEDPVRIIRGVKYSIKDGLKIRRPLYEKMQEDASLIENVSTSRLYEELVKILQSGESSEIFKERQKVGILNYILPKISYDIKIENPILIANMKFFDTIVNNFQFSRNKLIELGAYSLIAHVYNKISTDNREAKKEPKDIKRDPGTNAVMVTHGRCRGPMPASDTVKKDLFTSLKVIFRHFNIPNKDLENIVKLLMNRTSMFLDNDAYIRNLDEQY